MAKQKEVFFLNQHLTTLALAKNDEPPYLWAS